jgi:hypothetical protein
MFEFLNTLSVADKINALLLITALIGIFLTYGQTRHTYKTQKAAFFKDLYSIHWKLNFLCFYGRSKIKFGAVSSAIFAIEQPQGT